MRWIALLIFLLLSFACSCNLRENKGDGVDTVGNVAGVELWRAGISSGYVRVDMSNGVLSVYGYLLEDGWASFEVEMDDEEISIIRGLVANPALKDFTPESEWFGEYTTPNGSSYLVVIWPDHKAIWAIPPREIAMASSMPDEASRVYDTIRGVSTYLSSLESSYYRTSELTPRTTKPTDEFVATLHAVHESALPQTRRGW